MSVNKVFNIYISTSFWFNCVEELNNIVDAIREKDAEYLFHTSFDNNNLIERTFGNVVISEFEQGRFHRVIVINDNSKESIDFISKLDNYFDNFVVFKVETTKVSNIKLNETHDVYCGRGSDFGNPHQTYNKKTSIEKFKYDFENNLLVRFKKSDDKYLELRGKTLGCYCHPKECHAHTLALDLNSRPKKN